MLECQYCNETFGNKGGLGIHEKHCVDNPESEYRSKCKKCGDIIHSSKDFCDESCAATYNNKRREHSEETKLKISKTLNKTYKCNSCNNEIDNKKKFCKECSEYSKRVKLYKELNVYKNGNLKEANKRAKQLLYKEYVKNEKSTYQLEKEYGIHNYRLNSFMKNEDITVRDHSEALGLAVDKRRANIPKTNKFNQYHHKTWDKKIVFLRSSYEKRFAEKLDKLEVEYEVENKSFHYKDKNEKINRYIPDFYLPNYNLIVEIKSGYTLDKEEYTDKKCRSVENSEYDFEMLVGLEEIERFNLD